MSESVELKSKEEPVDKKLPQVVVDAIKIIINNDDFIDSFRDTITNVFSDGNISSDEIILFVPLILDILTILPNVKVKVDKDQLKLVIKEIIIYLIEKEMNQLDEKQKAINIKKFEERFEIIWVLMEYNLPIAIDGINKCCKGCCASAEEKPKITKKLKNIHKKVWSSKVLNKSKK